MATKFEEYEAKLKEANEFRDAARVEMKEKHASLVREMQNLEEEYFRIFNEQIGVRRNVMLKKLPILFTDEELERVIKGCDSGLLSPEKIKQNYFAESSRRVKSIANVMNTYMTLKTKNLTSLKLALQK